MRSHHTRQAPFATAIIPSRRTDRLVVAALLLLNATACRSWQAAPGASTRSSAGTSVHKARLKLRDGPPLVLSDVIVRTDSVTGHMNDRQRSRLAFAHDNVSAIETRRVSAGRTIGLVGATAGALALLAVAAWNSSTPGSFYGNSSLRAP
jgi:hypothetical protein